MLCRYFGVQFVRFYFDFYFNKRDVSFKFKIRHLANEQGLVVWRKCEIKGNVNFLLLYISCYSFLFAARKQNCHSMRVIDYEPKIKTCKVERRQTLRKGILKFGVHKLCFKVSKIKIKLKSLIKMNANIETLIGQSIPSSLTSQLTFPPKRRLRFSDLKRTESFIFNQNQALGFVIEDGWPRKSLLGKNVKNKFEKSQKC